MKMIYFLSGGFGLLAEFLARKYPETEVIVFEQEHVIQMAQNLKQDMKITMIAGKHSKVKGKKKTFFCYWYFLCPNQQMLARNYVCIRV